MAESVEIEITSHTEEVKEAMGMAILRALEECGALAEKHAKQLAPVDTGNLRNSITHKIDPLEQVVYVGSNVEYAVYQEMGTGKYAEGGGGRPTPWVYQDANGKYHRTEGNKPQPFIKPAVADHINEYRAIIKEELGG